MLLQFVSYNLIGLLNTLIHWIIFLILLKFYGFSQAASNIAAFAFAVTFSYFANAAFTFKSRMRVGRYALFIAILGGLAAATGAISERYDLPPLVTLVVFSSVSLAVGFITSKFLVFGAEK
ncbi:GtrA family protein [Shinella pollutisoli]|uniref:GtrA family protein n=1 Tax=Shinella pollutisoli TaxID=2250594 RepID=A0ABV7DDG6_9HYPH